MSFHHFNKLQVWVKDRRKSIGNGKTRGHIKYIAFTVTQLLNNPEENGMPTGRCMERFFPWAMVKSTTDFWAITLPHEAVQSSSGSSGFWDRLFGLAF